MKQSALLSLGRLGGTWQLRQSMMKGHANFAGLSFAGLSNSPFLPWACTVACTVAFIHISAPRTASPLNRPTVPPFLTHASDTTWYLWRNKSLTPKAEHLCRHCIPGRGPTHLIVSRLYEWLTCSSPSAAWSTVGYEYSDRSGSGSPGCAAGRQLRETDLADSAGGRAAAWQAYLLWIMVLVLQVSHVGPRGPAVIRQSNRERHPVRAILEVAGAWLPAARPLANGGGQEGGGHDRAVKGNSSHRAHGWCCLK